MLVVTGRGLGGVRALLSPEPRAVTVNEHHNSFSPSHIAVPTLLWIDINICEAMPSLSLV